jgi:hypothetical protein
MDTYDLSSYSYKDISNVISDKLVDELMVIWNRNVNVKFCRFIFTKKYKVSEESIQFLEINSYTLEDMIYVKLEISKQYTDIDIKILKDSVEIQVVIIKE